MKRVISLFVLLFVMSAFAGAQTPQYYNYNNGTVNNSFPLNIANGKMSQTVVPAGTFGTPTPAPAGNITKLYFRIAATYPLGPATYSTFKIMLQHVASEFVTTGSFITGAWDTVYKRDTVTLQAAVNTWLEFTLDHSFAYNPTQPLAISMEHCGAVGTTTGYSLCYTTATGSRRIYSSTTGCPHVYSGVSTNIINCGVDISTTPTYTVPELIYYKFENNPTATSTPNTASAPVGTNPATVTGLPFTTGGEFDTCISGTGGTGSTAFINTGWSWNITGNWTMSFWVKDLIETSSGSPTYLFGDPGASSFRCFYAGAAYPNNMYFRGAFSTTGYLIPCPMPGQHVFHIVFNGSAYIIYRNGVLLQTNPSTVPVGTGTGFKVGGYSTSSFSLNGKMDEFRLYNRALDTAEISATWNMNLGVVTGVTPVSTTIPTTYSLSQNYPNPFNPVTKINFGIPKSGLVTLKIYDVVGKEIKTLVNDIKNPGTYIVDFDGSSFASGTYFYRLESNGFVSTKKMMLIK